METISGTLLFLLSEQVSKCGVTILSRSLATFIYLETSRFKEMFIRKKDVLYLSVQFLLLVLFALFSGICCKSAQYSLWILTHCLLYLCVANGQI